MPKKSDKETITELSGRVNELTKVLSALIGDIDDHRNENTSSCYWWKESFMKDLEVSDKLKESLGIPPDKYEKDDY